MHYQAKRTLNFLFPSPQCNHAWFMWCWGKPRACPCSANTLGTEPSQLWLLSDFICQVQTKNGFLLFLNLFESVKEAPRFRGRFKHARNFPASLLHEPSIWLCPLDSTSKETSLLGLCTHTLPSTFSP